MVDISDFYQNSTVPQLMNEPVETAVEKIEQANLTPVVIGSGTQTFAQSPKAASIVSASSKVFIQTSKEYELPDFIGWTKDEVVQFAMLTGLEVDYEGEGYIIDQSVAAGEMVTDSLKVTLTLSKDAKPSMDSSNSSE